MGSDLHMNPPRDERTLSQRVAGLEADHDGLRRRLQSVIALKSRLEEQSRRDAITIIRLTRELDAARAAMENIISGGD